MQHPHPFATEQGRHHLYTTWLAQHLADHRVEEDAVYTLQERCVFLAEWLRWCISEGHLDPHARLPPYDRLATVGFDLESQDVAQVIVQLRGEQLLPPRKQRKDANQPQWTPRDHFCLSYIGHMHALRLDQIQRLLGRTAPSPQAMLSFSRTWEIVDRWVQAEFAVSTHIYYKQPGWVWLTHKGLHVADLSFRAGAPSTRSLEHLYWINEVRMMLEEEQPEMHWISERALQAGKTMREAGQQRTHLPDGILVLPTANGEKVSIDIEVQISKPIPQEVKKVLAREDDWTWDCAPLRYYVGKAAQGVVRSIYHRMKEDDDPLRPFIEIIDLEVST